METDEDFDAVLLEFRDRYSQELPAKFARIAALWEDGRETALEEVRRIAHELAGSAGTFGLHKLSEIAAEIEMALADRPAVWRPDQALDSLVRHLVAMPPTEQ